MFPVEKELKNVPKSGRRHYLISVTSKASFPLTNTVGFDRPSGRAGGRSPPSNGRRYGPTRRPSKTGGRRRWPTSGNGDSRPALCRGRRRSMGGWNASYASSGGTRFVTVCLRSWTSSCCARNHGRHGKGSACARSSKGTTPICTTGTWPTSSSETRSTFGSRSRGRTCTVGAARTTARPGYTAR